MTKEDDEKKVRTETQAIKVAGVKDILKFVEDKSLQALSEYVIVPFVKIIQGMSEQKLKDEFGEGAAVLRPGDIKIGDKNTPFLIVPLFFFTMFRKWGDRKDSVMIYDSTYDPNSTTAKKARDLDKREEVYEGDEEKKPDDQRKYRYVEHLCFIVLLYDGEQKGERCVISFQKGDFRVGRAFASGAQMRKVDVEGAKQQVPLWAQIWQMIPNLRERKDNRWWGLDPVAPPESIGAMISPDEFEDHAAAFEELSKAHAANLIRIDGDDSDPEDQSPVDNKEF